MNIQLVDNTPIGKKIAELRKEKGYTQLEIANLLNVARATVAEYERGRIHLNVESLIKLAIHFNISADQILGLKISPEFSEDNTVRIMKRLRKINDLPESKQKTILSSIDMMIDSAEKKSDKK